MLLCIPTGTGGETENDSSSDDELMRRSRLNTGASVASAASAISAVSAISGVSAVSGVSAGSAASSHSGISTVGKMGAANSCTSFGRDNFNRKSRCVLCIIGLLNKDILE